MKNNSKKTMKNPFQSLIDSWKKIDSEKRIFIIIIVTIFVFINIMPDLYKGWVSFRDNGYRFGEASETTGNNSDKDEEKNKIYTMVCTQSLNEKNYSIDIKTVVTYANNQLKSENHTVQLEAINDLGKKEVKDRKIMYDDLKKAYDTDSAFKANVKLKNNVLTFNVVTDYSKVDYEKYNNEEVENASPLSVEFKYNENIKTVKSYYQNSGMTCRTE